MFTVNAYYTLIAAVGVLLLGRLLVKRIRFLQDFNIPEPVAGGLVVSLALYLLYAFYGVTFTFDKPLQTAFMLAFFSSIGLSADFSRLQQGGKPLVIFLAVVSVFIVVQNAVGTGMAAALGLDPRLGLVAG
ncbi:MAG: sodium/glutamate symporter, partial [Lautropia sp.]|nr:sodium/glutamate symporter [Lautropia sp.]